MTSPGRMISSNCGSRHHLACRGCDCVCHWSHPCVTGCHTRCGGIGCTCPHHEWHERDDGDPLMRTCPWEEETW